MAVAFTQIPACRECIADLACPIFVDALTQLGYTSPTTFCPGYEPSTESVRFLEGGPTQDFGIAQISDPPGDPGTDQLSGGDYPAVGALDYSGYGSVAGSSAISCVLPMSHADLCQAVVHRFVFLAERT